MSAINNTGEEPRESARRVAANEFEEKRIHVIMTQRRARREGGAGGVILFVYSSSKKALNKWPS